MFAGAVVACLCLAGAAHASSITISGTGGPMTLRAGNFSTLFQGADPHKFSAADLQSVHNTLHADGVTTDGFVTFLLADTSEGLSFLSLIDDNTVPGSTGHGNLLGMSTTGPSSANYFINDVAGDNLTVSEPPGSTSVFGDFAWDNNGGDAFAWTGLGEGDSCDFSFSEMSGDALAGVDTFQFVTWNGQAWEVVDHASFTGDGQFAFSFAVVPLPAPVLMGLVGLAGVIAVRRRRLS
jgi:hypothetical protein